ncbi:hypothetical protein ElyMa_004037600 [Elysia marginata]|uniref:Uncharacterized protein n=1 Tax=Elysia marginata TaxID=1093978 RepID=A0AAV4G607_9GAST|nr:hypothetical protein ElyMa_004037600 [Elysia marginata]
MLPLTSRGEGTRSEGHREGSRGARYLDREKKFSATRSGMTTDIFFQSARDCHERFHKSFVGVNVIHSQVTLPSCKSLRFPLGDGGFFECGLPVPLPNYP